MPIDVHITYHQMERSPGLDEAIRGELLELEQIFDGITRCRVVVDQPHKSHRQGNHFRVQVDLHVPGAEIVVDRDPAEHASHEDPYLAVSEAFSATRRKLEKHEGRRRAS